MSRSGLITRHDLGGVAPSHVLELAPAHRAGVAGHAALGAPVRQLHQGALPAHEHRECGDFGERDAGMVPDAALGGPEDRAVMDPVAEEHFRPAVVHARVDPPTTSARRGYLRRSCTPGSSASRFATASSC